MERPMRCLLTVDWEDEHLHQGDYVDVVAFVWRGSFLVAVIVSGSGHFLTIPAWTLREEGRSVVYDQQQRLVAAG